MGAVMIYHLFLTANIKLYIETIGQQRELPF